MGVIPRKSTASRNGRSIVWRKNLFGLGFANTVASSPDGRPFIGAYIMKL
jgi:hypothetical protein